MATAPLAEIVTGLALAVSFALLATRRIGAAAALCAIQAALAGLGALSQGSSGLALAALAEAAILAWAARQAAFRGSLWDALLAPEAATATPRGATRGATPAKPTVTLAAAALLAALAASVPAAGLALAVILLGLLLLVRPDPARQVVGIVAMQNGLMLAAIDLGLDGGRLVAVAVPLLPAAAIAALWLGRERRRLALLQAPRSAGWGNFALCGPALLVAGTLPWHLGRMPPLWLLDARAAQVILLLCALSAAASWADRAASLIWGARIAVLAGTVFAVLSDVPLASWLGMVVAALGAASAGLPVRAEAWRRLCLGCAGLGLALFGSMALRFAALTLPAGGALAVGYGTLAVLAPELAVAAVALILRVPGAEGSFFLLAIGLAGLLIAAAGQLRPGQLRLPLVDLAQGSVAVFAFGLGSDIGHLAGLLQLSCLALTRCGLVLARQDGLDRLAAMAGLAGLPPCGLFASLALILLATAAQAAWLLLPLGAGLAVVAWALLRQLPAPRPGRFPGRFALGRRLPLSAAWLPLALLVLCSFAMPAPLLAWFRLATQ